MNAAQTQILKWCNEQYLVQPHIYYCTGVHRFGPYCRDCSGMTYMAYKSASLTIGADTGAIAQDVHSGRARFVPVADAQPGDLLLYRAGSTYNGGSDEHVGIKVRNEGSSVRTWESRGHVGHAYVSRLMNFWDDGVHYFDLDDSPVVNNPEEDDLKPDERLWLKAMFDALVDDPDPKNPAHNLADKINWIGSWIKEGGYAKRGDGKPSRIEALYNKAFPPK